LVFAFAFAAFFFVAMNCLSRSNQAEAL
jgi:hypothetical protein